MANRPANAGSGRGLAPMGDAAPPLDAAAPPPPVHHDAHPPHRGAPHRRTPQRRTSYPGPATAPPARARPGESRPSRESRSRPPSRAVRAAESRPSRGAALSGDRGHPGTSGLAWLPYLVVLAGAAAGMFVAWQGSKYAGRGTGLVGCSLLAAALARLILPARYAGLLSSRRKASDVLAFAVFGAAVLAVALMLP